MKMITVIGNLCHSNEIKKLPNGDVVLNNSVSVNEKIKGKDAPNSVTFFKFAVFGKQSEFVANYTEKGCKILLVGELQQEFFTKRDGTEGNALKVANIKHVEIITWKDKNKSNTEPVVEKHEEPKKEEEKEDCPF